MLRTVVHCVLMVGAMAGISMLLPGFEVDGWGPAILAAVVLALMNAMAHPFLSVLTLPSNLLTLGLLLFVINASLVWLTAAVVPGFRVRGFGTALLASLLLSLVGILSNALARRREPVHP